MLENRDKIMHLRFNFDACPMHSPFRFVHLTHQNLSVRALFCHNSLAKVNTQLLIYKYNIKISRSLNYNITVFPCPFFQGQIQDLCKKEGAECINW